MSVIIQPGQPETLTLIGPHLSHSSVFGAAVVVVVVVVTVVVAVVVTAAAELAKLVHRPTSMRHVASRAINKWTSLRLTIARLELQIHAQEK